MNEVGVHILILAAGEASRMGEPKQLLEIDGQAMLVRIMQQAKQSKARKVHCVLGAHAAQILPIVSDFTVNIINNAKWKLGIGSSIAQGVKTIQSSTEKPDGIMVLLADQPEVSQQFLDDMIHLFQENPNAIVASQYGVKLGVPAIFPTSSWEQLQRIEPSNGAQKLINTFEPVIGYTAAGQLHDIDTPEEYQQYIKNQSK